MTLFINACVRKDSRTKKLAGRLLERINDEIQEVKLEDVRFPISDEEFLNKRDSLIYTKEFDNPMFNLANQFAKADRIVLAAPYWDMSFPASVKLYFEHINVRGITFEYTDKGVPVGLCKAKQLIYISTSGGPHSSTDYGFGYVKALCQVFYGIKDVRLVMAEGLDVYGADQKAIMEKAFKEIDNIEV